MGTGLSMFVLVAGVTILVRIGETVEGVHYVAIGWALVAIGTAALAVTLRAALRRR